MMGGESENAARLLVRAGLEIPRGELVVRATRSGGPGGQHVNKTSSRIELQWNVRRSSVFTPEEIERIATKLANRMDAEGWLRVVATESRSQLRNRIKAEERLAELVRNALHVPKKRRATKPTAASREKRIQEKKRRGQTKSRRSRVDDE